MSLRVLTIIGTRPEAIKMAPVLEVLRRRPGVVSKLCSTGQHREMLDQVLGTFSLEADIDLKIMRSRQMLNGVVQAVVGGVSQVIDDLRPDRLIVHGDTSTAMAAAIAGFNRGVPVAHVEAGLRTYTLDRPWPEEFNRRIIDVASDLLFAPTEGARENLLSERLNGRIIVTGNTVIDALRASAARLDHDAGMAAGIDAGLPVLAPGRRLVLVTGHRRENLGAGLAGVCAGLKLLAAREDVEIVYPVHLNPAVSGPVREALGAHPRIHLIPPQEYLAFVRLMQRASLIISDSGGVQEEAAALGKPLLVTRNETERPEAVAAGAAVLVGADPIRIVEHAARVLDGALRAGPFAWPDSPFGDGRAAERIADALLGLPVVEYATAAAGLASPSVAWSSRRSA